MLEVKSHARKGRGLYASRLISAGETVLTEEPVLLVPAPELQSAVCCSCMKVQSSPGVAGIAECPACRQAGFCSPSCEAHARSVGWVHSPAMCGAYAFLGGVAGLSLEDHSRLRFLAHACALRHLAASDPGAWLHARTHARSSSSSSSSAEDGLRYAQLLALVGDAVDADMQAAAKLLPLLAQALGPAGVSLPGVAEVAALLRKEQLNSYGIPMPSPTQQAGAAAAGDEDDEDDDDQLRLRGSAMYAQASLINHECAPNVARFDNFDAPGADSTHMRFRAMHDLPAGTELCQSYCPLNWGFAERQVQCAHVYGFRCTCPRCQTESTWSDADEDEAGGSDASMQEDDAVSSGSGGGGMEEADAAAGGEEPEPDLSFLEEPVVAPPGEEGPLEPQYLRLFLLKYLCPAPSCFGTMAPRTPGDSTLQCAKCGGLRSDAEFIAELEAGGDE